MTDRHDAPERRIAGRRSALLYLFGSLLQGLGLILIQPFAVRLLSEFEWGLVATSIVLIQVVVVLLSAGLPLAITQLWFDQDDGRNRARAMYGFLAIACLAIGGALAVGAGVVGRNDAVGTPWTIVLAMLIIGLLGTVLGAQAVLRAQDRPVAFVVLSVCSSVVANLAGLGAILVVGETALVYIVAYGAAVVLSVVVALFLVRPRLPWKVSGMTRASLTIAAPLLPHTGALMLLTQGAVLLLAQLSGASEAGRYGAVLIFALGPLTILNALNNSWSTRIMSADSRELHGSIRAVAGEAAVSALLVGLLASSAANIGAHVLTTDPGSLVHVAQILPTVSLGYALFLVAGNVLYVVHRTRLMAFATPAVLLVTTSLAILPAAAPTLTLLAAVHGAGFAVLGATYLLAVRRYTPSDAWPSSAFLYCAAGHVLFVVLIRLAPVTLLWGAVELIAVLSVIGTAALFWLRRRPRTSTAGQAAASNDPRTADQVGD
ncbi:oligosaccharide flippase family protein [Arthrobacter sp. Br18]|uniref:lipopolysaccharide biosynthesis protein n=1 Tax=Arthrobacter sp. Br18 TaxID=1312954 RepID=UPI00047B05ED|nr:oligosaccharide flippase family protein [Arthrobacter sp. Br18]